MSLLTTWRTDDPCPVCGTGLHATDNHGQGDDGQGDGQGDDVSYVHLGCPLCGWSATWQADLDGDCR